MKDKGRTRRGTGTERGAGMLEIMIVVAIVSILAVITADSYRNWVRKYRVENDAKELYTDLMDARARAMQRNRAHFADLAVTRYRIYEDTNPAPDGNGTLESAAAPEDALLREVTPWNALFAPPVTVVRFNPDGTLDIDGAFLRFTAPEGTAPDYDCITLRRTRLRLGRFDATGGTCVER